MSVLNPKTRLVSFRLSQEEYSELCALCSEQRARSISDFVRDSMHWILGRADESRYPSPGRDPLHRFMDAQPTPASRPGVSYLGRTTAQFDFSALADMLVDLHRRTEALDRQVHNLALLIRSSDARRPPGAALPEEDGLPVRAAASHGHDE